MASPTESKVDESEVTSNPQNNHHGHQEDEDDDQFDLGFPLMRQSSIYSLTLDEIQNTVCEPGKSFGSMNMDEFLNNIWNVEEAAATGGGGENVNVDINVPAAADDVAAQQPQPQQASLQRQGSLSMPAPLCRKTVDEVWAEIHREERPHRRGGSRERKATMGEMTLEDFLIKAGVVREPQAVPAPTPPPAVDESPSPRSVIQPPPPAAMPLQHNFYPSQMNGVNASLDGGYMMAPAGAPGFDYSQQSQHQQQQQVVEGYGGPVNGNSYQLRLGSPGSPVSSDGLGSGHVDNVGGVTGSAETANGGAKNGRKRTADGGVEKVVERRQRRMIKNRESAARSRARKQAYTVELEAELNMLKEENACLRADERRAKAMRKQVILECMAEYARNNVEKTARSLRRANSAPW